MSKKDRLLDMIEHFSAGNKSEFARMIGVSPQTVNTWITRDTFDIDAIYAKCENISAHWLLTGSGPMLKDGQPPLAMMAPSGSPAGIPLIPLDAVAGFPVDGGAAYPEDCKMYIIPEFEARGANFLIRVAGDSMSPLYRSGDIIACRKIRDILFFQWGSAYVLETSQGVIVKYVEECETDAESVMCVSENPRYHPFRLPMADIRSLSSIIGLVRID